MQAAAHSNRHRVVRGLVAGGFVLAGINHFISPAFYRQIIPPSFPKPGTLVAISGVCEIAGGLGLLIRPLRRPAAWGLLALLAAVFPANIYMARHPQAVDGLSLPQWALNLRLPLQGVLMYFVYRAGLAQSKSQRR